MNGDPTRRPGRPGRRRGFTLVEMIIVMVIAGLLVAITLPAITRIGRATGLDIAAQQLAGAMSMARSYAISHRTSTYVLIPVPVTFNSKSLTDDQRRMFGHMLRGIAVFTFEEVPGEAAPQPQYLSEWQLLPDGVVIVPWADRRFSGVAGNDRENYVWVQPAEVREFPFPNYAAESTRWLPMAYVRFTPQGLPERAGNLVIAEGWSIFPLDETGVPTADAMKELDFQVDRTGAAQVVHVWPTGRVEVFEAVAADKGWKP